MLRIRHVDVFHDEEAKEAIAFMDSTCFLPTDCKIALDDEASEWWIAYEGNKTIGYGGLNPAYKQENNGLVYLSRSGVLVDHRGQGIQRRLIKARLRWAKQHGFNGAVTDTTDNIPSANSLIACGFKLYRPKEPWSFNSTLYWRLLF